MLPNTLAKRASWAPEADKDKRFYTSRRAWVPPITSCYPREATHAFFAAAHLASRDSAFWTATTARSATRNALFAYSRAILAMISALLHASSKCLPVKNCSDNVESIWDTGLREEALAICTRATVGARQRLWVSQVWFLDPGFFVDSGRETYYKHCGRFTFEK